MIPLFILVVVTLLSRAAGFAGYVPLETWRNSLVVGLLAMFIVSSSAHWGKRRPDLVAMVPSSFSHPGFWVTITGVFELAGVIGLALPQTRRIAAILFSLLLVVLFPANVHAAKHKLTIGGRPVPGLGIRLLMQLIFIACLLVVAF